MDEHSGHAREWRETGKKLLDRQFRILDPMRRKFIDRKVDSSNEIVEFDLQDVREADIILVNYNKPSIGTSMEIFYASHDLGKFVVAFSPFEFQNCSPWMVRYCTKILGTLEEACEYINTHFRRTEDE
jgi:nucleoside 2-deoxyribosyltransferase